MRNKIPSELSIDNTDYVHGVMQTISSYIKEEICISGTIDETITRTLFDGGWDHQADCDRYTFACIELIKLLSSQEIDNLIGEKSITAKGISIEMLCRLIPFLKDLQYPDSEARLDLAYLQITEDVDVAARYKDKYTTKLALRRLEKKMQA